MADIIKLTHDRLSVEEASQDVASPVCGAISLFVGTTRDNFEGKTVRQLEYEAYDTMAEKVMKELCNEVRGKWKVENIAIYHRLGDVPVGESSVVIAISSEHRKESLAAVQYTIDSLKASVPIWKKEVYDEASGSKPQWKENRESLPEVKIKKEVVSSEDEELDVSPDVAPHLIQIKASSEEVRRRIEAFMARKREEVNRINIRDFCTHGCYSRTSEVNTSEWSCARVDALLVPRKDSKSHLRVRRVLNPWGPQTRGLDPGSLPTPSPSDPVVKIKQEHCAEVNTLSPKLPQGVEERITNMEQHLKLNRGSGPIPMDIYARLKRAEERILYLESLSPEYFTSNITVPQSSSPIKRIKKQVYSAADLRRKLHRLEKN